MDPSPVLLLWHPGVMDPFLVPLPWCLGVMSPPSHTLATQRVPCAGRLRQAGVPCPQASIGSTPSCSHPVPEMAQLTELHPGNYLFYGEWVGTPITFPWWDLPPGGTSSQAGCTPAQVGHLLLPDLQQTLLGSCHPEEVAIRVLTRVIGHYPHRNQLLVDCGWAALSLHGRDQAPPGCAAIEGHPQLR